MSVCLNLGIESENNKRNFYAKKSKSLILIFKHWWIIQLFFKFLVEVCGFEGTGYMVSS